MLVLAEADRPAAGGTITASLIVRAAEIVNFTINCWRALPEQGGLALTQRDEKLDRAILRLIAWLEEHGGESDRRELQRHRVAGVRTPQDLDALLERSRGHISGVRGDDDAGAWGHPGDSRQSTPAAHIYIGVTTW